MSPLMAALIHIDHKGNNIMSVCVRFRIRDWHFPTPRDHLKIT